ncbi:MAG: DNA polymerase III subunit gamma/tau [Oscillospiraceae bacterium]|nr:DNA polymerase III subunit gamma/tau [Oscillospiraceae bacterium]
MYQALYRKYRPQTFDDVVGQLAVTQTLKSQMVSGKLSHAYLFTGSRGTGKTSCAKILAKAVNCENIQDGNPCNCCKSCRAIDAGSCMDVLEIDAASNNGVDNVRDLRDDAIYTPSQVKKRVYIIDEVHMLSVSAFNALLKIIEEPPEHLLFILATTELHKVPATILSRCQRFSFRRISQEDIAARLQYVSYQENIDLDESAARVLARLADGGMRDGLSLLDQCASATAGELNTDRVYACLGIAGIRECGKLMTSISQKDTNGALELLNRLYAEGKDMGALLDELACLTRDLMILKTAPETGITMLSGVTSDAEARALSQAFSMGELTRMLTVIQNTAFGFLRSTNHRMDAEICLINLCHPELDTDISGLLARITRLEEDISTGDFSVAPVAIDLASKGETVCTVTECAKQEQVSEEITDEAPIGFWSDLVSAIRPELNQAIRGFFTTTPNAPLRGILAGERLVLACENRFIIDIVNKPEILEIVSRKASAKLQRPIRVVVTDDTGIDEKNEQMEQLLNFGRAHGDIISIKNN